MRHDPESAFLRFRESASPEALGEVFDVLSPGLLSLAGHLAGPRGGPEDLVQGTFVEAILHRQRWDASRPLMPWLVGILIRLHRAERRRAARHIEVDRLAERASASPLEQVEQEELSAAIAAALEALPDTCRPVLVLRLVHGLTPPQIAGALGRPLETVRSQLRRGREQLRDALPESVAPVALAAIAPWLPGAGEGSGIELLRAELLRRAAELLPSPGAPSSSTSSTPTPPAAAVPASALLTTLSPLLAMKPLALALGALLIGVGLWAGLGPGGEAGTPSADGPAQPARAAVLELTGSAAPAEADPVPAAGEAERLSTGAEAQAPAAEIAADDRITGRVRRPDGSPAAGARVRLLNRALAGFNVLDLVENKRLDPVAETTADASGAFAFDVAPSRAYRLELSASPFARLARDPVFGGEHLELQLDPGAALEIEVRDTRDGSAVVDAKVRAWVMGGSGDVFAERTDTAGRLWLDGLPAELLTIEVEPLELANAPWRQVALEAGQETALLFELEPGLRVTGRVTESGTGAPIADAEVGAGWTFDRAVRTDIDGRYELFGFGAPGVYSIHARGYGYGQAEESFDFGALPEADFELDFALPGARTVYGRVVDPLGAPLAGAVVSGIGTHSGTDWHTARTDDEGRFRLESLDATGRHQLLLRCRGYATRVLDLPADELERPELDLGEIALSAPARVAGAVRTPAGEPLPGLPIEFLGVDDGRSELEQRDPDAPAPTPGGRSGDGYTGRRVLVTDSNGRFHFDDVAAGSYHLRCHLPGAQGQGAKVLAVEVAAGVDRVGLELEFDVGPSAAGRVVDADGRALSGAGVVVYSIDADGNAERGSSVETAAGGRFELLSPAPPEGTELWVVAEGQMLRFGGAREVAYRGLPVRLERSVQGLELRLPRPAELTGRLLDATGAPLEGAQVTPRSEPSGLALYGERTDADGAFAIEVPRGLTLTVEAGPADSEAPGARTVVKGVRAEGGPLEIRRP